MSFHGVSEGLNFTDDVLCGYLSTAEPGYDWSPASSTRNGLGGF